MSQRFATIQFAGKGQILWSVFVAMGILGLALHNAAFQTRTQAPSRTPASTLNRETLKLIPADPLDSHVAESLAR